jgi:CheY-like chemotaxis protein
MAADLIGKPILIAEDFEPDARLLEATLKRAGVVNPLFFVSSGNQVVAYLQGDGIYSDRKAFPFPGVLMLDLKMPEVGGFEVLEWCRSQTQLDPLLIVVLSGYSELRDVNRAYQLGAKTFLAKPTTEADILEMIQVHPGPWSVVVKPRANPDGPRVN